MTSRCSQSPPTHDCAAEFEERLVYVRSALVAHTRTLGLLRGRPGLPAIGGIASTCDNSWVTSLRLASVRITLNPSPAATSAGESRTSEQTQFQSTPCVDPSVCSPISLAASFGFGQQRLDEPPQFVVLRHPASPKQEDARCYTSDFSILLQALNVSAGQATGQFERREDGVRESRTLSRASSSEMRSV